MLRDITRDSSDKGVASAYQKLSRWVHPDKNGGQKEGYHVALLSIYSGMAGIFLLPFLLFCVLFLCAYTLLVNFLARPSVKNCDTL